MKVPEGYDGPELVTILKESKKDNNEVIAQALEALDHATLGKKVGVYTRDKPDGDFTKVALEKLGSLDGVE